MTKRIKALIYSAVIFFACLFGAFTVVFSSRNVKAATDTTVVGNEYFYTNDSEATISFGVPVPAYEEGKPYYEQGYSGVKYEFGKTGGTVYYGKEIDARALTKDRVLLELMPLTTTAGARDYNFINVVLTDVENPDITLTYRFNYSSYYNVNRQTEGDSCFAKVGGQNQDLVGLETKSNIAYYNDNPNGCHVYMSFEGTGKKVNYLLNNGEMEQRDGRAHKPLKIYFDYENQIAYASEGRYAKKVVIADLKASYATAEWTGFQSNKVRLSVSVSGVSANQAALMLFNVMDNDFSGETMQDNVQPEIYVDTFGYDTLPVGVVHEKYPVFHGDLVDNFDGDIPFNPYILYNGEEVEIIDGYFYPKKVGVYSIYYEGKDSVGLEAKPVRLDVSIQANLPAISYEVEGMPTEGKVGKKITLPKGVPSGGSGRLDVQTTLRYPDGTVKDVDDGFTPETAGAYRYNVRITDFLGTRKTFVYWIKVEMQHEPIVNIQALPTTLVNGASYYMSSTGFEAYDYFSYDNKADAVKTVTLKDEDGNVVETHQGEGFFFKADKEIFGEKVKIEWKAKSILYAYTTIEEKEFTIVDVKKEDGLTYDMDKYFYQSDIESVVDNYQDGFNAVFLTTKEDAYVEYLLPMPESAVGISFDVPVEYNNFEKLTVRLTDSWDASLYVDMSFMKNTKSTTKSLFTMGGTKTYEVNGCFRDEATDTGFELYVSDGYVKDKLGTSIGKIPQYANGKTFDGFPSGNVYVSVRIEEVGELEADEKVGVLISKISNQFVFDVAFDGIVPQIIREGFVQREAELGEEVYVPFARGFDVVNGSTKVYLTVTTPDKQKLCENYELTEEGFTFTAYQTGKYSVSFMTMDDSFNTRTQNVSVMVYDEIAPIVSLEEPIADTYALGTRFKVPTVNVVENTDQPYNLMLLLVSPKGSVVHLEQTDTHVLSERGKYMLTVMVQDAHSNITMFMIPFTVK